MRHVVSVRFLFGAAALALIACQGDAPTEPTRLAPTRPAHTLTGGVGTPIFPISFDGDPQPLGFAIGLNASGQVTGAAHGLNFVAGLNAPFRWTPGGALETIGACEDNTFGTDINASGVIVGTTACGPFGMYRPFVAAGNHIRTLPLLPGLPSDVDIIGKAQAFAINDPGDIVGISPTPNSTLHAVRWTASGAITDLGTLGGSNSQAIDINNAGQIIGTSQTAGNAATHAFLWSPASGMQDLSVLIGQPIGVLEINDAGQIAGSTNGHAVRYTPGSGLIDLGTLGGTWSEPTGMNDRGEIVGLSTLADGTVHAFLWTPADGMEDITALAGLTDIRRLNDNLQTLTVTQDPAAIPGRGDQIPRLVQLQVTQSNVAPIALFTSECNGLTCVLDASGSLDDKPGLRYAWDLGTTPVSSASGAIVTFTYHATGAYTVTLTVTDANGVTNTHTDTVDVSANLVAAFTVSCTGLTCTFDSSPSTHDPAIPTDWEWKFGDGTKQYLVVAPTHVYAQPGTYDVRLEMVEYTHPGTPNNRHAIVTHRVTVGTTPPPNQPPVASFTASCTGLVCTFDGSSSTDDHGIVSYTWDLNRYPEGSATGVVITRSYPHAGTRNVTLTVTDANGASSSVTHTIVLVETDTPPVAAFTSSCSRKRCRFDASTSTDDHGIVSYAWHFDREPGHGGKTSDVTAETTFPHGGTHHVTLTVTDTKGQTNSVTHLVTVE